MVPEITELLRAASLGDRAAYDALYPHVYGALRRIAAGRMRAERQEHTLSPTALVHEVYMKLGTGHQAPWQNRSQFFAIAARAMRQILVDHALAKRSEKRGGGRLRVTLADAFPASASPSHDVLALEEALARLEAQDGRRARVVVCRFYGGMDVRETAEALGISEATVKRDWIAARAWLNRELRHEAGG